MIEVRSLFFSYGKSGKNERNIINDLSISLPQSGLVSILGPNGSGKTTLVKCLAGILNPNSGDIYLKGSNLKELKRRQVAKMMSYVPQECIPAFNMSIFDFVMLGRLPFIEWSVRDEDLDITRQTLKFMNLEALSDCNITELSGGQRQLASIARALAQNGEIILMDEPLSALDIRHCLEVMSKVTYIVRHKRALVVLIMHDIELAAKYSDEIIVLKDGCLYDSGPPEQVITSQMLYEVYGIEAQVSQDYWGCRITWEITLS